ncbi:response regulator [Paludicola sp. MB14-C6]|uniref:response regulator n=1 Tax=Paludihabitans sp. MB14-C6 TaxID=3070656 RepID=UPI0027DB89D3|nr:response regulator [Paludicola sp. MB14-C6]WMJ23859.1 response regulator [Paludicola sp. MB14-C6]
MTMNEIKILICDDSILVRKNLKKFLTSLGCSEIYEAVNGQEAIEKYKESKPDLVFMDIVMPVKTGLDALIEILDFDTSAKVVMVSSVGTQSHLQQAIESGAFNFVQKPIENEFIRKILENFINGGK